jgi:hypothetical protein
VTKNVELLRDLRSRAYSAVPRHDDLSALVDELKARQAEVRHVASAGDVTAELVAAVVAGDVPLPDDPTAEMLAADEAARRNGLRARFVEQALAAAIAARKAMVAEHAPPAFKVLAVEVDEIMGEVVALGDVPTTAQAAVDAGRADEFRQLQALGERHTVLRAVHAELWGHAGPSLQRQHTSALWWLRPEIVAAHDPVTRERLQLEVRRSVRLDGSAPVFENAWPGYRPERELNPGPWPVRVDAELAFLKWASGRRALWAPSPREFAQATSEIGEAVSAAIADDNAGRSGGEERAVDPKRLEAMARVAAVERESQEQSDARLRRTLGY